MRNSKTLLDKKPVHDIGVDVLLKEEGAAHFFCGVVRQEDPMADFNTAQREDAKDKAQLFVIVVDTARAHRRAMVKR